MKYTMVKQFSNSAIDNIFNFWFKIIDFGKILWETMISFFEIWVAFYLIFFNFFMYFYYLVLFALDWGTESNTTIFFWRRSGGSVSKTPSISKSSGSNPIPSMYVPSKPKVVESAVSAVSETVSTVVSSGRLKGAPKSAKRSIVKTILELIFSFFSGLKRLIISPAKVFVNLFERKMKPVRDDEHTGGKSLIDEYMKEYQNKRK